MKEIKPGHVYDLDHLEGGGVERLRFVDRGHGTDAAGTVNQEVIRALISRVEFLDAERPWGGNRDILRHLRMALVLHEARAMCRKVEKETLKPETVLVGDDQHYLLTTKET